MEPFSSPTYPYPKVSDAPTMRGAEEIPHQVLMYLLDLPDRHGYVPVDDNRRPRTRLAKYLWHDGENPLSAPLPTPQQKLSMLFDPSHPDINSDDLKEQHPKGYRLFWQKIIGQSQLDADVAMNCYIGKIWSHSRDYYSEIIGVRFEICVNVNLETNVRTNAYQRSFNIEQCLREALNGVNLTGIGAFSFNRNDHPENGSGLLFDDQTNVGRWLNGSLQWVDGGENPWSQCVLPEREAEGRHIL